MSTAPKQVAYPHVEYGNGGAPFISGTTMKVVELVMAQRAHGWSPEELSFQYPYLSMAQIHSALAYYWDHRDDLDEDVERRMRSVEATRAAAQSPLAQRLARTVLRRTMTCSWRPAGVRPAADRSAASSTVTNFA